MRSLRSLQIALLIPSLLLSVGCITIGQKTEREVTFVDKYDPITGVPIKVGRVDKNVKVPVRYETDAGKEFTGVLDIGGWSVVPPPLPEVKPVPSFAVDAKPQYAYHMKVGNAHSTCFPYAGGIVTAAHCMDGKSSALVWDGSEWVGLVLTKIDTTADVAFLEPDNAFLPPLSYPTADECWAHVGSNDGPVMKLKITKVDNFRCTMSGFAEGGSGSPVFVDGKLYGMARAYFNRKNWRGRWVKTDDVEVVPLATIDEVLKR